MTTIGSVLVISLGAIAGMLIRDGFYWNAAGIAAMAVFVVIVELMDPAESGPR